MICEKCGFSDNGSGDQAHVCVPLFKFKGTPQTFYQIDFDKVNTVEDIKNVLKAMDFRITEEYMHYSTIKHLVKEI